MTETQTDPPIIRIIAAIVLLVCWLDMPYGYFQFVRFGAMVYFGYLAYLNNEKGDSDWMIFWALSALLVNPLFKVALGRILWNILDILWAVVLIYPLLNPPKKDKTK